MHVFSLSSMSDVQVFLMLAQVVLQDRTALFIISVLPRNNSACVIILIYYCFFFPVDKNIRGTFLCIIRFPCALLQFLN